MTPERQGVEQVPHLEQVDTVCFGGLQHIEDPLLEPESVGHHQIGIVEKSHLGSGCPVVVRIGADRKQYHQVGISTHDIRHQITQDRGGCGHQQTLGLRRRLDYPCRIGAWRRGRPRGYAIARTARSEQQQERKRPTRDSISTIGHPLPLS